MAIHFTDKLLGDIQILENNSRLAAKKAGQLFEGIILSLVSHDRYDIVTTGEIGNGIDIEVMRKRNQHEHIRIGFQIKYRRQPIVRSDILALAGLIHLSSYEKVCLITNAGLSQDARESVANAPFTIELLDLQFLRDWANRIRNEADNEAKDTYGKLIKAFTVMVVKSIVENPFFLDQLEWRELEKVVAELFAQLGFEVTLTPPSKDGGKDVILEYKVAGQPRSSIIEVKHWKSKTKVGSSDVKEFVEVVIQERRDTGVYLSTYGYTGNAFASLTEIERRKIRSSDQRKIYSLCRTYMKAKEGLWLPPDDLDTVLYEETNQV